MKRKFFILSVFVSTAIFCQPIDFDEIVESFLKEVDLPSACISVCTKDSVLHKEAYGYKNLEEKIPATVETLYPLGSISKSFTSVLFGIHSDEGVIHFDDKIVDLIPFFRLNNQVITDEITIRDYLSHQSGYGAHDTLWVNQRFPRSEIVKKLRYIPEIFPHRRTFYYQNIGYMVASHALECKTGKSWEELVEEKILQPLDLSSTYLDVLEMQKQNDFAYGYIDLIEKNQRTFFIDPYTIAPSGGLCSNIEDLTKWTQFFLGNGDPLLSEEAFKEIHTPQIVTNLIKQSKFVMENLVQMESYGLGLFITIYQGKKLYFHSGNILGFTSLIAFVPEDDIGISIIVNKDKSVAPYLMALTILEKALDLKQMNWCEKYKSFKEYEKNSLVEGRNHELSSKHQNTSPSHDLSDFTGTYEHPGYGSLEVVMIDGALKATYNDLEFPLDHWHYDVFSSSNETENIICRNIKFSFNSDFSGNINLLSVVFEPESKEISFVKRAAKNLFSKKYLSQFAGKYSYFGVGFSIDFEDGELIVKAPGQPPYPLVPQRRLEFSVSPRVEGMEGYGVEFTENENGEITSVQLIQPGGAVYSASRYE